MNKILGIDQSLSKCAFCYMENGNPIELSLSKTGASKVKTKRKDVTYYDTLPQQIHHVCKDLLLNVQRFRPDCIVFEALSFGSVGNASRDLACLYGAMRETLMVNFPSIVIYEVAPTSLKTYAHSFLKEERKWDGYTKAGKPKKIKMDKKLVVEAVKELYGETYLKSFNYSTGLDDLADATFLAHKIWTEYATKEEKET